MIKLSELTKFNIFSIVFIIFFSFNTNSNDFSSRENFNKLLKGFYKNDIYRCSYISKSWSTGFEQFPYGMVINSGAFKNILVFRNRNVIGTLWPNIGEISLDRGVRKYQLWKKSKNEEFILLNSDYLEDLNSADIDLNGELVDEYKTYFDEEGLKISIKPWITDFYSCVLIDSSNFAKKKLIDIFVNQNDYVKKDFAYREKNPSLFNNKIELLPN
ncbi:MAG: hypothetical protein CMM90_00670 [Rickettsiales bacterium]|nr:hypothetical protein [Rickettsiales bacterium]|tara:strand:- start:1081 stop:1725 length:645 start_codon:yes stop_codon:yes gene_type:complete